MHPKVSYTYVYISHAIAGVLQTESFESEARDGATAPNAGVWCVCAGCYVDFLLQCHLADEGLGAP